MFTKKYIIILIFALGSWGIFQNNTSAEETADGPKKEETNKVQELLKKHACIACHKQDAKLIGPSYDDVVKKYKDEPQAVDTLVEKVIKGGKGTWGEVPMPPNAHVPEKDIRAIVTWLMKQKPASPADLMKKHGCIACHKQDAKLIGPSYDDVVKKYKDDPKAIDTLVEKVIKGGKGTWGEIPMPPNAHIPEKDIRAIITWLMEKK